MAKNSCKLQVYASKNDDGVIKVYAVYDLSAKEFWNTDRMAERGLLGGFLGEDNLKESLNWYLNGDSKKYKVKRIRNKKTVEYIALVFD